MCPLPSSRRPDSLLLKGGLATRRPGRSASNDSPPEGGPQTGEETVPIYCRYIDIMSRLLLCVDTRSWGQMWGGVVLVVVWGVCVYIYIYICARARACVRVCVC